MCIYLPVHIINDRRTPRTTALGLAAPRFYAFEFDSQTIQCANDALTSNFLFCLGDLESELGG